jgi:hypothetical protein
MQLIKSLIKTTGVKKERKAQKDLIAEINE